MSSRRLTSVTLLLPCAVSGNAMAACYATGMRMEESPVCHWRNHSMSSRPCCLRTSARGWEKAAVQMPRASAIHLRAQGTGARESWSLNSSSSSLSCVNCALLVSSRSSKMARSNTGAAVGTLEQRRQPHGRSLHSLPDEWDSSGHQNGLPLGTRTTMVPAILSCQD